MLDALVIVRCQHQQQINKLEEDSKIRDNQIGSWLLASRTLAGGRPILCDQPLHNIQAKAQYAWFFIISSGEQDIVKFPKVLFPRGNPPQSCHNQIGSRRQLSPPNAHSNTISLSNALILTQCIWE
jgi:hypothetical protein